MNIKAFHGTVAIINGFHPLSHFGSFDAANQVIEGRAAIEDSDEDKKKILEHGVVHQVDLDLKRPFPISDNGGLHRARDWADLIGNPPALVRHEHGVSALTWKDIEAVRALKDFIFQPIDYQFSQKEGFQKSMSDEEVRAELAAGGVFKVKNQFLADREGLCRQRMIAELKKLGFDSFVYVNKEEDKGHVSWIIFDPEQATIVASSSYSPLGMRQSTPALNAGPLNAGPHVPRVAPVSEFHNRL